MACMQQRHLTVATAANLNSFRGVLTVYPWSIGAYSGGMSLSITLGYSRIMSG